MVNGLGRKVDKWHKTRIGLLVFSLVELSLAYGAVSWAIDSGNLLLYLATIILLYNGIYNFIKCVTISLSRVTKH
ncbi:MAG TPA: hypothetical protein VFL85_02765 [Candidatus Saccharimonadales bacterium]|nr:hypothetical protein [Candidatus Saccharimonadales bacterium]